MSSALFAVLGAAVAASPAYSFDVRTMGNHREAVTALAFSPDGGVLASGSADKTVRLWGLAPNGVESSLPQFEAAISALAFAPQSEHLAVATLVFEVRWVNLSTGSSEVTAKIEGAASSLAVSPDESLLAVGTHSGKGGVFSLRDGSLQYALPAQAVAFSADGRELLTAASGRWRIVDSATGKERTRGSLGGLETLARFSSDGKAVVAFSRESGKLSTFSGKGLKADLTVTEGGKGTVAAALAPGQKQLLAIGLDRRLRLWRVDSKKLVTSKGLSAPEGVLQMSRNGAAFAVGDGPQVSVMTVVADKP